MGATDYVMKVDSVDRKVIQERWAAAKEADRAENGNNGYTGGPSTFNGGVAFNNHAPFDSFDAASDFILDTHEKRDSPIAVQFKQGDKILTAIGGWAAE